MALDGAVVWLIAAARVKHSSKSDRRQVEVCNYFQRAKPIRGNRVYTHCLVN